MTHTFLILRALAIGAWGIAFGCSCWSIVRTGRGKWCSNDSFLHVIAFAAMLLIGYGIVGITSPPVFPDDGLHTRLALAILNPVLGLYAAYVAQRQGTGICA